MSFTSLFTAKKISTHSLTRRLTVSSPLYLLIIRDFNSQPHEEADQSTGIKLARILHFNSQPHEEADL